ncbi:hypothetical protein [Rhizobium sp. MHM7A]|uniref:hypothetical protein n=1 Tax=Rhizobium sp. MHM7A TaxID=2583233 RepID=UPI00110689D0|nr:hypothetical protein [Rhizobium sp. MHM7A]TLX17045.1 hypothetical protein FFR93_06945 [Rhizobium sp. MHM7A]
MNKGPYQYGSENDIFEKKFGDRTFTVVLSNAYNAGGIIGSEYNGIAILDENFRQVVLDRQLENRGFLGSDARKEFDSIKDMTWEQFTQYVRKSPRYRGGIDDIDRGTKPNAGDILDLWISKGKVENPTGPDLRTEVMKSANANDQTDYSYPDATRDEMIVALARHEGYYPMNSNNGGFVLAWDIKVRGDCSASKAEGFKFNEAFNERWKKFEESDSDVFFEACSDALWHFTEGNYEPHSDEDIRAKFYTNGRQGGHLVLSEWNGAKPKGWATCPMAFDNREHFISWLKELPDNDLVALYGLVRSVDIDTADPAHAVSFALASIRQSKEEQWKEEATEELETEVTPTLH